MYYEFAGKVYFWCLWLTCIGAICVLQASEIVPWR